MTPWQVLYAGRARVALGYRVHHGPGVLVHHNTALAAAPDNSRSFCLSKEKVMLQQLNRRLALYLQKVRCLEAANQKLELQIQEELARKCPGELRELDGHLRTASLLQDQIGECLSAQAKVKLQLLSAELTSFDLKDRCEKEHEHRSRLEAELNDLRLLREELKSQKLPELQSWLNDHSKQLMELQMQHQQHMQGLLVQVSGDVAVKMQTSGSSDLIQQMDHLRQTGMALMNRNQNESFVSTQVSMLSSPEMTFEAAAKSEVDQAELEDLRRTAAGLEGDLKQLKALNVMLETSGLEQTESFVLQLEVLQQRADRLCNDLDSVLQAAAQQATDHQTLLDIRTRLETEINDYKRLLDRQSQQRFSDSVNDTQSYHATTRRSAFRRNITVDGTLGVKGGNLRIYQCQTVPRDSTHIIKKVPLVAPLPMTVTTGQTSRDISKHPKSQTTGSVNRINWTGSFQKSENKRVVGSQVSQSFSEGTVVTNSTPEINSTKTMCVQAKPKTSTSKQTITEAFKQTTLQTEISKATIDAEPSVIEEHFTHKTVSDPSGQTGTDAKEEKETFLSLQVNYTEGFKQANIQDQTQVFSSSLKTPADDVMDADGEAFRASDIEGLETFSSEDAQVRASTESSQMNDKDNERKKETTEKETLTMEGVSFTGELDQVLVLSSVPSGEHNKVMEVVDTVPCMAMHDPFGNQGNGIAESTVSTDSESHTVELSLIDDNDIKGIDSNNKEVTDKKEEEEIRAEENSLVLKAVQSSLCNTFSSNKPMEDSYVGSDVVLHSPDTNVDLKRKTEVVNSFDVIYEVKLDSAEINLAGKEAPLRSTEPKKSTSRSDSGVDLSLSSTEELSQTEPVTCLRLEICRSPAETDVLMSMSDQVFCPLDLDVRSPDYPLSPEDPHMFLSPNNETCLSPVETKECLSPNFGEEDEEVCLSPTEANMHIRPLEKYVLTTKEEENKNISISERDNDSVCFGSFEDNKASRVGVNSYKLTGHGIGSCQVLSGPGERSVIADKEKQLGFGGLYRRSGNAPSPIDRNKVTRDNADMKSANNQGGRESPSIAIPAVTGRPESGRFDRRGSGEWMVYSTLGRRSSLDDGISVFKEEKDNNTSVKANLATSTLETGRFGSRGSGEWKVYSGNTGRMSSSPGTIKESAMLFATSPPETFGSKGNGEWLDSSGSLKRTHSQGGSDELHKTVRRESQPTTLNRATSPIETGRFGSRGSGEWRVYSGGTGRISRWSASNSLPNADSKESPLADRQLATSPPVTSPPVTSPLAIPRTGRFASGGSGEWRVYGGSPGRLSSAGNADSANCSRIISPPSSRTSSAQRLSSSGSNGRLSSGGVVRRSSSVGSGGRLSSSSGSHRTSSSGRYATTGSGEWKPVYSSVSGHSAGSAGTSGGVGKSSCQRALSPVGTTSVSVGSGGWLSSSTAGGSHMSSPGSGSKLSRGGSNDRVSSQPGGRISSSSGSGRISSSGGRVISSSNRSNRSTGSGAGSNKERISVCKMAALSISAAGRERQNDKRTQAKKSQPQQAGGKSPVVQRWLITGVGVTSDDPEGLDDIMHL